MYKKVWCKCKVVVLRNKPIAFLTSLVAVAVVFAKAPYWTPYGENWLVGHGTFTSFSFLFYSPGFVFHMYFSFPLQLQVSLRQSSIQRTVLHQCWRKRRWVDLKDMAALTTNVLQKYVVTLVHRSIASFACLILGRSIKTLHESRKSWNSWNLEKFWTQVQ